MHTKLISWEKLREDNRLTILLKSLDNEMLWFFLPQLSEIGLFSTAHLALSGQWVLAKSLFLCTSDLARLHSQLCHKITAIGSSALWPWVLAQPRDEWRDAWQRTWPETNLRRKKKTQKNMIINVNWPTTRVYFTLSKTDKASPPLLGRVCCSWSDQS